MEYFSEMTESETGRGVVLVESRESIDPVAMACASEALIPCKE